MRVAPTALRARLALLFALGSGALVAVAAGFLYVNLDGELQAAINQGLRARGHDIAAEVRQGSIQVPREEAFAQVLDLGGRVLGSSPTVSGAASVLLPDEFARTAAGPVFVDRDVQGLGRHARLLARRETSGSQPVVIVVGTSRAAVVRGQRRLLLVLAVAGPLLIGALTGGGWLVAGAALRPVRRMTEEAAAVSPEARGRRLAELRGDDEIAQLGRTLNAMLARIEASVERERAFLDDASHELRTPIAILRAELELGLLSAGDRAATEAALASAIEEADRLTLLADDLLVLARAGHIDQAPHRREPVDLAGVVERVRDRLAGTAGPQVEVSGSAPRCAVDPVSFEQAVVNLVVNARRHAAGRVLVDLAGPTGGLVEVTVADDGPGFPPSLLPRAFDRFSRAEAARGRRDGGTGLGLAIVDAVARAHGGSVEATNGPPLGGAVVRLRLPAH